ncbi:MAG: homoserine kinase [Planctomycetota bacterium]
MQRHTIKVPGSTSNLGPGFDMLGLCLDLFLKVELEWDSPKPGVERSGEAAVLGADAHDLVQEAFLAGLRLWNTAAPTFLRWQVHSEIPIARGLGSSGAAVAAGLLLACRFAGVQAQDHMQALMRLGTEIEGHPDNVVASLAGGCVCSLPGTEEFRVIPLPLHPSLGFAVAWGHTSLPTREARGLLPPNIAFTEAVDQPRRALALFEGLRTGDPALLRFAEGEHLHVHARLPRIRGGREALQAAHDAGAWMATISGSGSALFAIGPRSQSAAIAAAMGAVLEASDAPAHWRAAEVVATSPVE